MADMIDIHDIHYLNDIVIAHPSEPAIRGISTRGRILEEHGISKVVRDYFNNGYGWMQIGERIYYQDGRIESIDLE